MPRSTWNSPLALPARSTGNILNASLDPSQVLEAGLRELGLPLRPDQRERLVQLATLLSGWAQRINLTGHRGAVEIMERLVLDALALERQLPPAARIADLGSGAGFPGLPLAVARPDAEVLLVEARERRHHFQRAAIRALGLERVRPLLGRIELLEPELCEGVVAQALAKPAEAVRLAARWAGAGAWIALPGSEEPPVPGQVAGVLEESSTRYPAPISGRPRSLWLGRRQR